MLEEREDSPKDRDVPTARVAGKARAMPLKAISKSTIKTEEEVVIFTDLVESEIV